MTNKENIPGISTPEKVGDEKEDANAYFELAIKDLNPKDRAAVATLAMAICVRGKGSAPLIESLKDEEIFDNADTFFPNQGINKVNDVRQILFRIADHDNGLVGKNINAEEAVAFFRAKGYRV